MRRLMSDDEQRLRHRMESEYDYFKYRMLASSRNEIYNQCNKIRFVECLREYVIYNREISGRYIEALLACRGNVYEELYAVYLKNESTKVGTWDDIEELLNVYIRCHSGKYQK